MVELIEEDSVNVRRLTPVKFSVAERGINEDLLSLRRDKDYVYDELVYTLTANIYAEDAGTFKYSTFSTKWDHFKYAVFPNWLLKKYPPKRDWHEVRFKALFPEYGPPDKFGKMVEFYELRGLGECPND